MGNRPPGRRRILRASQRRGAVLIEAALVMSLLLTLIFGLIEFGHFFYTEHNFTSAAQLGARLGILSTVSTSDAKAKIESELTALGYTSTEFTASVTYDSTTKLVTSTVEGNWGTVGVRPFGMIPTTTKVRGRVVMRKEGP